MPIPFTAGSRPCIPSRSSTPRSTPSTAPSPASNAAPTRRTFLDPDGMSPTEGDQARRARRKRSARGARAWDISQDPATLATATARSNGCSDTPARASAHSPMANCASARLRRRKRRMSGAGSLSHPRMLQSRQIGGRHRSWTDIRRRSPPGRPQIPWLSHSSACHQIPCSACQEHMGIL